MGNLTVEAIRNRMKIATEIQLLPRETKHEIYKLYDILAKAAIMTKAEDLIEKKRCENLIKDNQELFNIIANPIFYCLVMIGDKSEYFSDPDKIKLQTLNKEPNYTYNLFLSLNNFKGYSKGLTQPTENFDVNSIEPLLIMYNTPETEYNPDSDDIYDAEELSRSTDDIDFDDLEFEIEKQLEDVNNQEEPEEEPADTEEKDEDDNKSDEDIFKDYRETWGARIKPVINGILVAYDKLYKPGYGLVPPKGILTNRGIIASKKDGSSDIVGTPAIDVEVFLNLADILGDKFKRYAEQGEEPDIIKILNNDGPIIYTDLHIKFMFGHLRFCTDSEHRKRGLRSYLTKHNIHNESETKIIKYESIRGWIKETLEYYFYDSYKKMNITSDPDKITRESIDLAKSINEKLSENLKNVIAVVEYNEGINTKIRVCSDAPLSISKEALENKLRSELNTGNSSLIDVKASEMDNGVFDVNIIYNTRAYSQDSLFAYQVLKILKEQDIKPSWSNVILGKKDDGNIMTYNFKDSNNSVLGLYGSKGSGKGVMTLNLIASALADDCTLMYMDAKPDTAIPLCNVVWDKGLDAVVFNGKETPGAGLEKEGCPRTIDRFVAKEYLPEGLFPTEQSLERFILLNTYYRGLELFLDLAEERASVVTNGGHNEHWLVAIFDEVQQLAATESSIINQLTNKQAERKNAKEEVNGKVKGINYMQDPIWKFIEEYKLWRNIITDRLATALGSTFRKAEVTSIYIWQTSDYPGNYGKDSMIAKALMQESGSVVKIMGRGAAAGRGGSKVYGTLSDLQSNTSWYDTRFTGKSGGYWGIGNNVTSDESMTVFRPFNVYSNANDKQLLIRNAEANGLTEQDLIGISLNADGSVVKEIGFEAYSDQLLAMSGKTAAAQLNLGYTRIEEFIIEKGLATSVCDYIYNFANHTGTSNSEGNTPELHTGNGDGSSPALHTGIDIDDDDDKEIDLSPDTPVENNQKAVNINMIPYSEAIKHLGDRETLQKIGNRIIREYQPPSKKFSIFDRSKAPYGLHHLCWNTSIWYCLFNKSDIPRNTDNSIAQFVINYINLLQTGQIQPDYIPTQDEVAQIINQTFNDQGQMNEQQGYEYDTEIPDEQTDNQDWTEDEIEQQLDEDGQATFSAPSQSKQFMQKDGKVYVNTQVPMGQVIELNDGNSIDLTPREPVTFVEKMLARTQNGRSQIFENGIRAVIGGIDKKIPDRQAVTRMLIHENNLVVNGMLVNVSPLFINDEFGLRFEDVVNVKALLDTYKSIERLDLDSTMFEQVVMDYGDDAQSIWLLFQQCTRLRELKLQTSPGNPPKVITRQEFRDYAAEIQSDAKKASHKMKVGAVAAANNPRLSEAGIGITHNSYKIAQSMGGNFVKKMTQENPQLFRGMGYGLLAAGFGLVAGIGKLGSLIASRAKKGN